MAINTRIIWFLWYQGLADAPPVVKKCFASWKKHNPDWEVIFLDQENIKDYITLSLPPETLSELSVNHQSDITRIELLAKYGGVWADATSLCRRPLDEWLNEYIQSGFFAFVYKTRGYGWILSWFLAAEKNHPIVVKMNNMLTSFWGNNEFYHKGKIASERIRFLEKFLNRKYKTTRFWTTWIIRKTFKVYPYFIFHYMFADLINSNRELLNLFMEMKPFYNSGFDFGPQGLLKPLTAQIRQEIDAGVYPIYKLTHRYTHEDYQPDSIISYLLNIED
jgi:hypothetical protein